MKFGFRKPSLSKMIAASTSPKRIIRNALGLIVVPLCRKHNGWPTSERMAIYGATKFIDASLPKPVTCI